MSKRSDLETRIHSLGEIKEIMNAMKNLSLMETHRLSRFLETQRRVVASLEAAADDFMYFHPDLASPEDRSGDAYLLVGSERGFCGDFNESLIRALDRNIAAAGASSLVVLGSKLSAKLAGDPRVGAFLDGPSIAEEVEATLVKVMEALSGLNAGRSGPLRVTVFHHRAGDDAVRVSVLGPVKRGGSGQTHFSHAALLNLDPRALITGLAQQHLFAMLHELLYNSLMAENQRRMQHMDSAVRRLERTSADLLLRKNTLRQEEITEEIEIIMLSIETLK